MKTIITLLLLSNSAQAYYPYTKNTYNHERDQYTASYATQQPYGNCGLDELNGARTGCNVWKTSCDICMGLAVGTSWLTFGIGGLACVPPCGEASIHCPIRDQMNENYNQCLTVQENWLKGQGIAQRFRIKWTAKIQAEIDRHEGILKAIERAPKRAQRVLEDHLESQGIDLCENEEASDFIHKKMQEIYAILAQKKRAEIQQFNQFFLENSYVIFRFYREDHWIDFLQTCEQIVPIRTVNAQGYCYRDIPQCFGPDGFIAADQKSVHTDCAPARWGGGG